MAEEKKQDVSEEPDLNATNALDPADFNDLDPLALVDQDTEFDQLIDERDMLKDRLMRALAEAENTRKRCERDRRDAEVYGGSKLARDLLSVYDNLTRALETVDEEQRESSKALIDGIELTRRDLLNSFSKHKIERLVPKDGDKFDPKLHQAMFEAPIPGTKSGTVIQLLAEGFVIGDRLLRPAQVGVSSAVAEKTAQTEQAEE